MGCVRTGIVYMVRRYGCSMDKGIQIYRYGRSTFLLRAYDLYA